MQNFTFFEVPKYFFQFFLTGWKNQIEKRIKNGRKESWAVFLCTGPALQRPRLISKCEPSLPPVTAPPTMMAGVHLSGLSPLNSLPCRTLVGVITVIPIVKRGRCPHPRAMAMPTCTPTSLSRSIPPRAAE
jgi:hypothetical protein